MRASLRKLWEGWKEIAEYIGDFQARLLLTIFYFTVAVPFGLLVRLFGDPLNIRKLPEGTAWMARSTGDNKLEDTQRQF